MSWAPAGDRLAYFARTEKNKTLILQNVVTKKIEKRLELKTVDGPESPDFSPDGKEVAFSALRGAIADIFIINIETAQIRNVTNDTFGDYAPTFAPDGKSIIYLARVSGNDKLFRVDLDTGKKTQVTFGTHDDGGAQFIDADTIVFPSTAVDPNVPIDPEVVRNGNIYNIWTLHFDKDGSQARLKRYTDMTGNVADHPARSEAGEDRLRDLLQGRVRHPHTAARGTAPHGGQLRLRLG
jgi:Tol biopolymer transport system component